MRAGSFGARPFLLWLPKLTSGRVGRLSAGVYDAFVDCETYDIDRKA